MILRNYMGIEDTRTFHVYHQDEHRIFTKVTFVSSCLDDITYFTKDLKPGGVSNKLGGYYKIFVLNFNCLILPQNTIHNLRLRRA